MHRFLICMFAASFLAGCVLPAPAPPPISVAPGAPLDGAKRRRAVEDLAVALEAMYLKPEVGALYAAALRVKLRRRAYDRVVNDRTFGEMLTADLRAIRPDAHLRVLPNAVFAAPHEPEGRPRPGLPEGIEEMRMMGSVALLRFTAFPHDPRTAPAARDFLLANAGRTTAVILDARALPGGGIEVMDAILPLFFSERTVLASLETRAAGDKESPFPDGPTLIRRSGRPGYVTRDHIVVPDVSETRLRNVPVYYLTSSRTASAGEHLALVLKRTGRGTLIGERTRGAGHFVALAPLGGRLTALVPVGRAFDPDTGWDWEGKGISPDVAVPSERALEEALSRIG